MIDNNEINNILLLESLRAGIPSRLIMEKLPDLRSKITSQIDDDLLELKMDKHPKGRIIWGEYGQGKTHFLKMIEQHVMKQNFAVSYYTINRDLGLNNLKSLMPQLAGQVLTPFYKIPGLMNHLISDNLPIDFTDRLIEVANKISHPFPAYILRALLSFRDADEMIMLYNGLIGNSNYWVSSKSICKKQLGKEMKSMPKFNVKDYSICFMEFFSYLLKILGFNGWVILLDEAELIGKMGKMGRMNSYLNLSYLLNWGNEHDLPIYTLVASAKTLQTDVFFNKKNDSQKIPEYANQKLSAEFAYKLNQFFNLSVKNNKNLTLNPIQKSQYHELFQAVLQIHQQAIPWVKPAEENLLEQVECMIRPELKPVRITIRMLIEILDIYACRGELSSSVKEQKVKEYDLAEEDEEIIGFQGKGFTETPLSELFNEL